MLRLFLSAPTKCRRPCALANIPEPHFVPKLRWLRLSGCSAASFHPPTIPAEPNSVAQAATPNAPRHSRSPNHSRKASGKGALRQGRISVRVYYQTIKLDFLVPAAGLEPARPFGLEILSLLCLPFHHAGIVGRTLLTGRRASLKPCLFHCLHRHIGRGRRHMRQGRDALAQKPPITGDVAGTHFQQVVE